MSARSAYVCQIQGCNALLIILGLAAVGLAGSQFSKVSLENYRDIDLRLLNWIFVLTGAIGIYSLLRNHGSIVTKTLYCVSIVIGMATAVFYGITIYRVVQSYKRLRALENTQGFEQEYSADSSNYVGKIVIAALMIGIPALAALVSIVATILLDNLVIVSQPSWPTHARDQEILRNARVRLTSLAAIKLCLSLGTLGLAIFLEYEHELVNGTDNYIKIALDHIAALLSITSAVVDLFAVANKRQALLNFKVAIALSAIAATWCIKSVDNGMYPFYYNDLKYYRSSGVEEGMLSSSSAPKYIIVIVHGVLLGCFCLLFAINILTSVAAGRCVRTDFVSSSIRLERGVVIQSRCLGFLHAFWAACLMALVILGLLDLPWNGDFVGGDLLWMAVLFFCTGVIGVTSRSSLSTPRFVLSVVSLAVSVEKMCVSINLVYQAATYESYEQGDNNTFIGQIVLYSIQLGVLAAEVLTSLSTAILFGKSIARQQSITLKHSAGIHVFFSLGVLFYGIVITGCYVVFELGKWRYSEVPIEVPYFRLGNGPLAIAVFIVQLFCLCHSRLLLAATILQVIIASVALFTISYAITNTYYMFTMLSADDVLRTSVNQETILQVAIILAATSALACVICTLCGTVAALRSSYILHHKSASSNSTVVAPLEESYGNMGVSAIPQQRIQYPVPIQEMEEQSVYWSADENPYFYHTSKRYYGQPYQIDSGFYGYALASPDHVGGQNGVDANHQHRRTNSMAAQTRIGHVFDSHSPHV